MADTKRRPPGSVKDVSTPKSRHERLADLPMVVDATRGAVFVVQGNLAHIEADMFVVPTDSDGTVEETWAWLVGAPDRTRSNLGAKVAQELADTDAAWLGSDHSSRPRPRLALNVGGDDAPNSVEALTTRFAAALVKAEQHVPDLDPQWRARRARPLLAMPLIGTAGGNLGDERGGVIRGVLDTLAEHMRTREQGSEGLDVVLVCWTPADLAAVQFERRRRQGEASGAAWLDAVAGHAREGSLAVLFGAGASAGVGLPMWRDLLTRLAKGLPRGSVTAKQLESLDAVDAATVLAEQLGVERLTEELGDIVRLTRYSLTHGLLVNLQASMAITTNYDRGYEMAAEDRRKDAVAVMPWQAPAPGQSALLKLHGDADGRQLVLARGDFVAMQAYRRPLSSVLQERMLVGHVLTVGTSMSDATLVHAAEEVRTLIAGTRDQAQGQPVGTVILTQADPAREFLLGGAFAIAAGHGKVKDAAREVDVVLDWLGMQASKSREFVLDSRYADLFSGTDDAPAKTLVKALHSLGRHVSTGSDDDLNAQVASFLSGLGWTPRP